MFVKKYAASVLCVVISAVFSALCIPLSAIGIQHSTPFMQATYQSIGVVLGLLLFTLLFRKNKTIINPERHIQKSDSKWLIILTGLGIGAGASMLIGLTMVAASSAALLTNFSIVATAIIALICFKEAIPKKLWAGILLITLGCITISAGNLEMFTASPGLLFILLTCVIWGFSNNIKKKLALRNPNEVIIISNIGSIVVFFIIAVCIGEPFGTLPMVLFGMLTGFLCSGMRNMFFMLGMRNLPASKTAAIGGIEPYLSAGLSLIIFNQPITLAFIISLLLLVPGMYLAIKKGRPDDSSSRTFEEHSIVSENSGTDGEAGIISRNHKRNLTELRNYFTFFGFLIITANFIVWDVTAKNSDVITTEQILPCLVCGIFLLITAIVLISLRKRDLAGMTFLVTGMFIIINCIAYIFYPDMVEGSFLLIRTTSIFAIIFSIILLSSSEKKRFFFSIGYFAAGISFFLLPFVPGEIDNMLGGIIIAYSAFLGFISIYGYRFKHTKCFMEDENQDFKTSGSMLGFFFIAFSMMPWILYYLGDYNTSTIHIFDFMNIALSLFIMLIAIIMLGVGHSHFPGMILFGWAFALMLSVFVDGTAFIVIGIIQFVLGLLCLFRENMLLMPGLSIILCGISVFSSINFIGGTPLPITQLLLNTTPCLLMIYLAFAVFCTRKKMPVY